jgi:chemotaxis protein MotB
VAAQSAALDELKTELAAVTSARDGLEQELSAKAAELTQAQQALTQSQQELESMQQQRAESTEVLAGVRAELEQTQTALRNSQEDLSAAQQAHESAVAAQNAELTKIQKALESAELARDKLQKEAEMKTAALLQVQEQLKASQTEIAQWQKRQTETAQTLSDVSQELTSSQRELAVMQQQLEAKLAQPDTAAQLEGLREQVSEPLQDAIQKGLVTVEARADGVLLRVGGSVLFGPGQTSVRASGQAILDEIVKVLQAYPDYHSSVEGHTDNIPIGPQRQDIWPTNWELSSARAAAAVRYLDSKGIASERLSASGLSFYRPLVSNDTEEGRAQNRRIEIILKRPPEQSR